MCKVVGTTGSDVSASPTVYVCISVASVPSVSASLITGLSEGALDSPNAPKCCPKCRRTQFPEFWRDDFWCQVQRAYIVETNGSRTLQFGDGIEGWAGMPESGKLMHGFDTSQVSLITTKEAFYGPNQSLSTTLFCSTPVSARRECLVAI